MAANAIGNTPASWSGPAAVNLPASAATGTYIGAITGSVA
jgi:hypothetical protein